jgi:serine/threonine protein kinase
MGDVYLAEHATLPDIKCAVKVLHRDLSGNPGFVEMLRAEASRQSRLRHDNVVQIHDFFEWAGRFCLVQGFIAGETLSDVIATTPQGMPLGRALELIDEVLTGLDYAHEQGVFHCDVKPGNILVDRDGHARITDFGIARDLGPSANHNVVGGTPGYMSPEQARPPFDVDHRTDVYSTSVMLFEMLSGRLPFAADVGGPGPPPDIRQFRCEVPERLARIIATAMQPDREARFGGCADFLASIKAYQRHQRWVRTWLPAIAVTCVLAAVGAVGLQYWRSGVMQEKVAAASADIVNAAHSFNQLCRESRDRELKLPGLKFAQQSGEARLVEGFTRRLHDMDVNIANFASSYSANLEQLRKSGLSAGQQADAQSLAREQSTDPTTRQATEVVISDYRARSTGSQIAIASGQLAQRCPP